MVEPPDAAAAGSPGVLADMDHVGKAVLAGADRPENQLHRHQLRERGRRDRRVSLLFKQNRAGSASIKNACFALVANSSCASEVERLGCPHKSSSASRKRFISPVPCRPQGATISTGPPRVQHKFGNKMNTADHAARRSATSANLREFKLLRRYCRTTKASRAPSCQLCSKNRINIRAFWSKERE